MTPSMSCGTRAAAWIFAAVVWCVACAKSESGQGSVPAAAAGRGGGGGRSGAAIGEAGRIAGSAGQTLPEPCSDTATVRMPFPRLMSGAVWDLLVVEVRGGHFEIGIVNGTAVAGWSYEDELPAGGKRRDLYRLALFQES